MLETRYPQERLSRNTTSSTWKGNDLTAQTLRVFGRHALKYWPMLLLCATSVITVIGCDIISPLIYKRLFDQLAIDPLHAMLRGSLKQIYHTILLIAVVFLISLIGWRSCMLAVIRFESRTMKDLTDYCFAYLQNHSHRFFTDNFGGALV